MRKYLDLDLVGKAAVVTGASSGIGRAIAEAMAEAGANLMLVGRNRERRDDTVAAVKALGVEADIVEAAVRRFGGLNILVNRTGIFEPMPFETQPLDSFNR